MKLIKKYYSLILTLNILLVLNSANLFSDWEKIETIPAPYNLTYYLDVYILPSDPNYVWVCGRGGAVIRSIDGGKTWKTVSIRDKFTIDLQLEKIHFINSKIGFTSGSNRIYKTSDGGATWKDISDSRSLAIWGHWFADEKNGIQVGGGCVDQQQFFVTSDGGTSWKLSEYNIFESGLTHVQIMQINGLCYAVSSGHIWQSDDGGLKWRIISNSGSLDWQEQLAINGKTILVPFSGGCSGGGQGGSRISLDGGITWKEFFTGTACFGSYLLSPLEGWFAGVNSTVYYTKDGGVNWKSINCGIPPGTNLDDIKFYNDTLGYVVGEGVYKYKNYEKEKPQIQGDFPITLCEPDSIILKTTQKYKNYLWSTGEKTETIKVRKSGKYSVKVWNNDCDAGNSLEVVVNVNKSPDLQIISTLGPKICQGDTTILKLNKSFVKVLWNNNKSDDEIKVFENGKYSCEVVDSNGCKAKAEIQITVNPKPQITLNKIIRSTFCIGDSLFLSANSNDGEIEWYRDNVNNMIYKNSKVIWIKESGKYFVKVVNSNLCFSYSDTLTINFKKDTNKIVFEFLSSDNTLNFGNSRNESIKKSLKISNSSFSDFILNNILIFENISFSIPQSQFPITIPAKGSVLVDIIFNPKDLMNAKDTLMFEDVCSNHYILLKGTGIENEYDANGNCDVKLKLSTSKYGDDESISIGKPFPNPTIDRISIPILLSSKEIDIDFNIRMFDLYGNQIKVEYQINKNDSVISIDLKSSSMNNGVYLLQCSTLFDNKIFSIIIEK
jgi:photosystem II stability/assembly factor-like uncharacterized protein